MFDPDPIATAASGVHLITIDRPGTGSSDPLPFGETATIEQCADDIGEYIRYSEDLAKRISPARFGSIGVVGWGLGGFVALSFAARFPTLVDTVVTVACASPKSLRRTLRARRRGLLRGYPLSPAQLLGGSDQDPVLQMPGAANRLGRMVTGAYAQAEDGINFDLDCLESRTWTRQLRNIHAAVTAIYGELDENAPKANAAWFRRRIRRLTVTEAVDTGPLLIMGEWQNIMTKLSR
jgi:pimeloyl-ACP methyl ester carboxylesterase